MMTTRGIKWSQEQTDFLLNNRNTLSYRCIAKLMGKTLRSVESKIETLIKAKIIQYKDSYCKGNKTKIKVGHIKIKNIRIGDGQKKSRRKCILIALGKSKDYHRWRQLAYHLWELEYGPIPKNKCIKHVNGDTLDDRLENLELVSTESMKTKLKNSHLLVDSWVAYSMFPRDKELRSKVLLLPNLLDVRRQQILLNRAINSQTVANRSDQL